MGIKEKLLETKPGQNLTRALDQIKENEKDPGSMKLKEYIGFGLGRLCYTSIAKMGSDYRNDYYTSRGVRPAISGILMSAQTIFDSINDPIVATYIDRRKNTGNGRFKPFLAKLVPVLAVTSIAMFSAPNFDSLTTLIAWFFMTYAVWETINTFSGISMDAISTVMSTDPKERTLYTTVGNIGITLAGAIPGLIPVARDALILPKAEGGLGLMTEATFYTICAVVFATVGGAAGVFTKDLVERIEPPKKADHFWENFLLFFKNKELLLLWSTEIPQMISSAASGASKWFYTFTLGRQGYQTVQWIIGGIPQALVQPLAPYFMKRFRPSRIVFWCTMANGLLYLLMYPVVKWVGFGAWGVVMVILFTSLAFIPSGISGIAKRLLQLNTFDYTAARTGQRAEATNFMMYNMLGKWLFAIATLIGNFALEAISFKEHINGMPQPQTDATKAGLFFLFAIFPAIGNILGSLPMLFFKLEGKEYERRMAALGAVTEAKAELEVEIV